MDEKKPAARVSLEQALSDAAARMKEDADRKQERALESDKHAKLQSQLDALPQHERRRVLDATGQHRVCSAPRPLERIKNSGGFSQRPRPFNTEVKGATNWAYWQHVSTVEIWQALLLSLNIEPTGKGWLLDNAPGGTGDIPRKYLEDHGLNDEYDRRWFLVKNRLESFYASMGHPPEAELTNFIRLTLFAAWAVEFGWDDLPRELVALARQQSDAPEQNDAATSAGNDAPVKVGGGDTATEDEDWPTKAKAEADRIGLEQYKTGIRQITARSICGDVAAALSKDESTWGLQGARSSSNVRVKGLRGWKFTPPTNGA